MDSHVKNSNTIDNYTQNSIPTPTPIPRRYPRRHGRLYGAYPKPQTPIRPSRNANPVEGRHAYAANVLLKTVDFNMTDIKEWAILDSGATSHFLVTAAPTSEITVAKSPMKVTIPDGKSIQSTHTCKLAIPQLPDAARIGHIIPGLASHSLLSVFKLCNAGCEVTFTKIECIVRYRGSIVL